jgi:hypothetical protein
MSQLAPTSCIIVPRLEATEAIHKVRKSSRRSVTQAEETEMCPPVLA